jgi:hypothetical protein
MYKSILIIIVLILFLIPVVSADTNIQIVTIHNVVITHHSPDYHHINLHINESALNETQNKMELTMKDVYCKSSPIEWILFTVNKSTCRW